MSVFIERPFFSSHEWTRFFKASGRLSPSIFNQQSIAFCIQQRTTRFGLIIRTTFSKRGRSFIIFLCRHCIKEIRIQSNAAGASLDTSQIDELDWPLSTSGENTELSQTIAFRSLQSMALLSAKIWNVWLANLVGD